MLLVIYSDHSNGVNSLILVHHIEILKIIKDEKYIFSIPIVHIQ